MDLSAFIFGPVAFLWAIFVITGCVCALLFWIVTKR